MWTGLAGLTVGQVVVTLIFFFAVVALYVVTAPGVLYTLPAVAGCDGVKRTGASHMTSPAAAMVHGLIFVAGLGALAGVVHAFDIPVLGMGAAAAQQLDKAVFTPMSQGLSALSGAAGDTFTRAANTAFAPPAAAAAAPLAVA